MKKRSYIIFLLLIFLIAIPNIIALSEQKTISLCKKECSSSKSNVTNLCNQDFVQCRNNCSKKDKDCNYECDIEKRNCLSEISFRLGSCTRNCIYIFKNITCGNHSLGEVFYDNCSICKCEYNRRINCKKTDYCNHKKILRNKNQCISNNGLYQPLCNGPYFDIVCSKDNFCLCDGNNNYSCSADYICLHEFNPSLTRRGYTLTGWKNLLGADLGDIGICVK